MDHCSSQVSTHVIHQDDSVYDSRESNPVVRPSCVPKEIWKLPTLSVLRLTCPVLTDKILDLLYLLYLLSSSWKDERLCPVCGSISSTHHSSWCSSLSYCPTRQRQDFMVSMKMRSIQRSQSLSSNLNYFQKILCNNPFRDFFSLIETSYQVITLTNTKKQRSKTHASHSNSDAVSTILNVVFWKKNEWSVTWKLTSYSNSSLKIHLESYILIPLIFEKVDIVV